MSRYLKISDLPQVFPIFPLGGALLLPGAELPLRIFEPRYLNMIDDAMAGDRVIGMIQTAGGEPARPLLVGVGCLGRITSFSETSDGCYLITLTGVCRFRLGEELSIPTPYRQVRADFAEFAEDLAELDRLEAGLDRERFSRALKAYLNRRDMDIEPKAALTAPMADLTTSLSMGLPFSPMEKQALIEAITLADRFEILTMLLEIDGPDEDEDGPRNLQ